MTLPLEEHVEAVYRYALRLTGRPDLAEDLTQETLLRGWRNRNKLREPRAARLWLLRIATNVWTDHLRKSKVQAAPRWKSSRPALAGCQREACDEREKRAAGTGGNGRAAAAATAGVVPGDRVNNCRTTKSPRCWGSATRP